MTTEDQTTEDKTTEDNVLPQDADHLEPSEDASEDASDDSTLEEGNGGELMWRPAPGFGAFLRRERESRRMTLREAADELGLTYTRLQKMETGGRYRPPSLSLLKKMANLYMMQSQDLFREAGFDFSMPTSGTLVAEVDRDFEAITLHPDLSPIDFDEMWCRSFSQLQKQQWLEFAFKVEAYQLEHGPIVRKVLKEGAQVRTSAQPEAAGDVGQLMLNAIEGTYIGGGFLYWRFKPEFGPYLRGLREGRNLSIKAAAAALGLNFSALQRLETGDERAPTVELLRSISYQYNVHIEDVMRAAGVNERAMTILYRLEAWNTNFASLVTHPLLRPGDMNPRWIQSFSGVQQRQWVEFAVQLENYISPDKPSLKAIISAWRRASKPVARPQEPTQI